MLSDELWQIISFHLKPRHFFKLMCSCKGMKSLLDNDTYWERVALHAVLTQVFDCFSEEPMKYKGFFRMVLLKDGYCESMNIFIARVRYVIGNELSGKMMKQWRGLENAPLHRLVREGEMAIMKFKHKKYNKIATPTMKDVVKKEVLCDLEFNNGRFYRKLRKFLMNIDDDNKCSYDAKISMLINFIDILDEATRKSRKNHRCDDVKELLEELGFMTEYGLYYMYMKK